MQSSRFKIFLLAILTLALALPAVADEPAGKVQFLEHKCNKCHSIESFEIAATIKVEKMKGPDLSTAGDHVEADWVVQFVNKQVQREGKDHKGKFQGSKKELQTIADWIAALKAP